MKSVFALSFRTFSRKVRPTRPSVPGMPRMPPGMNPFKMPPGGMQDSGFDESDPNFNEALKNMQHFDNFVKGSDFEKQLDAFISQAMAQGK